MEFLDCTPNAMQQIDTTHHDRHRAINLACYHRPTQARAAWADVVERIGIQSAIFWPVAEIERFLAETTFSE